MLRPDGNPATREDIPWLFESKYSDGYYQHGGFWALPSSWVFYNLTQRDEQAAVAMLRELVADFQANGIYECINEDYRKGEGYVASICPIVGALKRVRGLSFLNH